MARNPSPLRFSSALLLAAIACAAEPPRQAAGQYRVTLRLPAEGLFAQEESQLEFHIEDLSRPDPLTGYTPVVRAAPQATIDMPAMPRMPQFTETAHAEPAPGDYGIHPTFAHGGDYRLRIAIDPTATVEFPLSVNDAQARRKPAPPRFTLESIVNPKKPRAGIAADLRLIVHDRDNDNAMVTAFETVHQKLLHLMIVRRDLCQFAHEHPVANADGSFTVRYTFPTAGEYRLFLPTLRLVERAGRFYLADWRYRARRPRGQPVVGLRWASIRRGRRSPLRCLGRKVRWSLGWARSGI
jgi:hypothetical protein